MSKENKPLKAIDADFVSLELDRLELNEGQLDGLPANPREILETKLDLLKKDIQAYPELMKYRMLLVYPLDNGKYIIIGGNMRYRAMLDLGYKDAPCVIIPASVGGSGRCWRTNGTPMLWPHGASICR